MSRKRNKVLDSFNSGVSVKELLEALTIIIETEPDAVVYVRQCEGTDFPPYLSIERQ